MASAEAAIMAAQIAKEVPGCSGLDTRPARSGPTEAATPTRASFMDALKAALDV